MPDSIPTPRIDLTTPRIDLNNDTTKEPISISSLLDRLGERKADFLNGIQQAIHIYIANQGRRVCMSIVETDGHGISRPRTHILNSDSLSENATYADVFQCFIRRKRYHDHALDSGLSEPVADIIAKKYGAVLKSCSDDLRQYFLGRLVEDEVVHKSLAAHIATLLAKKGIKTARDKLADMITHAIAGHGSMLTTVAVQHGVTVATQHTTTVTTATSTGAVVGSIIGAVLIKAFAAHITVILPKILASETFRMFVMAATHKAVYISATAATANLLAAKAGAATATAFLHAIIGPVAVIYTVYKLNKLPSELGESISRGVKKDLDSGFRSITEQVLDEMAKDVYDLEKLACAVVDDIMTVDGWEKNFEGLDVNSTPEVTSPQECHLENVECREDPETSSDTPIQPLMYFEDRDSEPSVGDRAKVFIESVLGQSLLWWPFKEPLRPLAIGMRRFTSKCDCGSHVYFNVQSQSDAVDTIQLPNLTDSFLQAGNSQTLPLHNPPSINLQSANFPGQSRLPTRGSNQLQPAAPNHQNQPASSGHQSGSEAQNSSLQMNGQFIYWCIDASDTHAQLVELDALKLTDHSLTAELLSEYATVTGWWYRFWTMSSCRGASFKKFRYLYDNQNIVSCSRYPELPMDAQYQYIKRDPLDEHRRCLEARIAHHLQEHVGVKWPWLTSSTPSISLMNSPNQLLQHIPKKVPQRLEAKEFNEGYGMQAVASMVVGRVITMFLVWHTGSVLFLVYWLMNHHGDLQNAFMVLTTTLAGFMIYLEILLRFRK